MKRIKKLCLYAAIALSTGIVGCNLFNPTESANIDSTDTDALTYEGYIHFRNAEYMGIDFYEEEQRADGKWERVGDPDVDISLMELGAL